MTEQILLVEDDRKLAGMIQELLQDEGYLVAVVGDGNDAVKSIQKNPPDLFLPDVMLPGIDGTEVIRQVRHAYVGVIVMLTAKGDELTEVQSLNRGADAFLEKPVRPHILLTHLRANFRQVAEPASAVDEREICIRDLLIATRRREVFLNEQYPVNT